MNWRIIALAMSTIVPVEGASAADQRKLAELLTPVYTAANFAAVCSVDDRGFFEDTRGSRGTSVVYMQHVKEEVIAGLPTPQATEVLVSAANTARDVARAKLRDLSRAAVQDTKIEVKAWCQRSARSFVQQVNIGHDAKHDEFLTALAAAKRD